MGASVSGYDLAVPGSMEERVKHLGARIPVDVETLRAKTVQSVLVELLNQVEKLRAAVEELQKQNIEMSRQLCSLEARY